MLTYFPMKGIIQKTLSTINIDKESACKNEASSLLKRLRALASNVLKRLRALAGSSMLRYIVRRLLYMIPVALGISLIAFVTMYAAGDPISLIRAGKPNVDQTTLNALRAYYGLDKPIPFNI
ncbi:MAG: hypothetical protein NT043_01935 [Candidatus Bathyarchaeota archaeon]|nr:hypothetical protein [Candidatus Bathyarchaeota archaeon]